MTESGKVTRKKVKGKKYGRRLVATLEATKILSAAVKELSSGQMAPPILATLLMTVFKARELTHGQMEEYIPALGSPTKCRARG